MSDDLSIFAMPEIKRIVQDLVLLLSHSKLAFLLGAGCSKIAGLPLMPELTKTVLEDEKLSDNTTKLLEEVQESFSGATSVTIEDYMSEIVDLLSITERRERHGATQPKVLVGSQERNATELQLALDEIKGAVSSAIGERIVNIAAHQQFVKAIHGSLQAGKIGRDVDYFVLNYDTIIEDALGLERVAYCDGFLGGATGWWDPNTFSLNEKAVRIFKLHGSIDWCMLEDNSLPRRIRSSIKLGSDRNSVLIYPAATKFQETQRDPFAQMLKFMRQSLCPSEGKEIVLVICGYSFGDSHIDLEIENALYQSKERLTLVAFAETIEPKGKLRVWLDDPAINNQIRVYTKEGFFHGTDQPVQNANLPWWKFEVLVRLLGGER